MTHFYPGQIVEWADKAITNGVVSKRSARENPCGTVTLVNLLNGNYIAVRRDGQKTSHRYHVDFWKDSNHD